MGIFSRLNPPVVELLGELKKQGYLLLVGSNTCDLHAEQYRVRYARELAPVSGFVLSYEVGVMKPSGEFFEACRVAAGGVLASECVFIDDAQANVDGACASWDAGDFVSRGRRSCWRTWRLSGLRSDLRLRALICRGKGRSRI